MICKVCSKLANTTDMLLAKDKYGQVCVEALFDKNGEFVIQSSHDSYEAFYYPKYCPECGRDLEITRRRYFIDLSGEERLKINELGDKKEQIEKIIYNLELDLANHEMLTENIKQAYKDEIKNKKKELKAINEEVKLMLTVQGLEDSDEIDKDDTDNQE